MVATPSNRLYKRHQRHARFARLRYGRQQIEFLIVESDRLASSGYEETLFGKLRLFTAEQVHAAANVGALA